MWWNWETVDACFVSPSIRIKSAGEFAGLCIGIIMMGIFLELLRRTARFYDRHIIRAHELRAVTRATDSHSFPTSASFRPSVWQQSVRTTLYILQLGFAYWIMLIADYRNGYVFFCVFIGASIGAFIFR
jgi:solute carrier family 31 (copper transporter), member 1